MPIGKNSSQNYASDNIYWYFPKGGTADTEEFRDKFRVFQSFEGENWTPALQQRFLDALHKAKLSVGQTSALTRIMKRVYENLGLCWVAAHRPIRLTPSGCLHDEPVRGYIIGREVDEKLHLRDKGSSGRPSSFANF